MAMQTTFTRWDEPADFICSAMQWVIHSADGDNTPLATVAYQPSAPAARRFFLCYDIDKSAKAIYGKDLADVSKKFALLQKQNATVCFRHGGGEGRR